MFIIVAEPELFEKPEGVAVPGGDVQIFGKIMMIEVGDEPHEVVGEIPTRRRLAQYQTLLAIEFFDLPRRKSAEVENMRRIGLGDREVGQVDLVERPILHAPKDVPPCRVERVDVDVSLA